MLFESRCDAIFDVLPARWPPDLFALRLRLAGNGRLFDSDLLKFGCVSLTALATQSLMNLRLAGHLIFFSLACALHAAVVSFRATASALGVFAASAGVSVAPPTTAVAKRPAHKVLAK
jgi:hypothetical protein